MKLAVGAMAGALAAALNVLLYATRWKHVAKFRRKVGYYPNVAAPRRYHEKVFWRKLFDHNPLFTVFSDKLGAKEYARGKAPELRIPRTLWTGLSLEDAPAGTVSAGVVIKANHGCNFNYFPHRDGTDVARISVLAAKWLRRDFGKRALQWGYYGVRKTLFAEERVETGPGATLLDLAVWCADGVVLVVGVILDNKSERQRMSYFWPDGRRAPELDGKHDNFGVLAQDFRLPQGILRDAVRMTEKLSAGIDYLRCDFLSDGTELYFGELTVYPAGGLARAAPEGANHPYTVINAGWDLRKSWFLTAGHSGWRKLYARLLRILLDARAARQDAGPR